MKEPQPDSGGMVRWNGISLPEDMIYALKLTGYKWSEDLECYQFMGDPRKYNNPGTKLDSISFHIDEFRKATNR